MPPKGRLRTDRAVHLRGNQNWPMTRSDASLAICLVSRSGSTVCRCFLQSIGCYGSCESFLSMIQWHRFTALFLL